MESNVGGVWNRRRCRLTHSLPNHVFLTLLQKYILNGREYMGVMGE